MASISTPQSAVKRKAPASGLAPKTSAVATPASEEWASVSPIIEVRLRTKKIPITGQSTAIARMAAAARCMNPN